jgi:hypothetical protein
MKEAIYTFGLGNNDLILHFSSKTLVILKNDFFPVPMENNQKMKNPSLLSGTVSPEDPLRSERKKKN